PPARAETGSNWTGAYYGNPTLSGAPVFYRIDPAVVFNWGFNPPGVGIGSTYWSASWQSIQYFNAGTYRFTITADDGVRVFVDGILILDAWRDQAATTYYVNYTLATGNHSLRVDYYQAQGEARIAVSWDLVQTPSSAWTAQYFNNPYLSGYPTITRYEYAINYFWGFGSPDPFIYADNFSARWTGTFPFSAATYRFLLAGKGGVRLFIDDILIIDRWFDQPLTAYSIDVAIGAGLHTLRVEYSHFFGEATARLTYDLAIGPPIQSDEWYAEYFPNQHLSGSPGFTRNEGRSGINATWTNQPPTSGVRENFSARWTRRVCGFGRPTTFFLTVDDGARLFVDNILIIDQWRLQAATTYQATVNLASGCHTLRLEYFQDRGQGVTFLTWTPPDGQQPILYPFGGQPPPNLTGTTAMVDFASALNVRIGPGVSYPRLTSIPRGTLMQLYERNADGSWVRMATQTGIAGWVYAPYLRILSGSILTLPIGGVTPPPNPIPTGVRGKLISGLQLRTGPSNAYPTQGILEWGTVVDIIGRNSNNTWLQVRFGAYTGWVYAPYVIIVSGTLVSVPITG
ncbi:MAG TPA: PA14 domain-containing protein, partial [Aggregatilineales bacterium]|nr:PA14 domain-containing protein [Aggregatilineales bacterium]